MKNPPVVTYVRPRQRAQTLAIRRNRKMARSVHAYVRGNTARYYEWLADAKVGTLPEGPAIWICGDCHTGNLGPVANDAGEIQIRDPDQTVIGNPVHDLIRLSLSLATAARSSDLPGIVTARIIEQVHEGSCMARVGRLVVGVGVFTADRAEIAARTVNGSALFVDDPDGAHHEAGDLILAGVDWARVGSLAGAIVAAKQAGRRAAAGQPVLFKSVRKVEITRVCREACVIYAWSEASN
ncbi:MAG: DUF2252 family protein, partial [Burkholderia gladioli]